MYLHNIFFIILRIKTRRKSISLNKQLLHQHLIQIPNVSPNFNYLINLFYFVWKNTCKSWIWNKTLLMWHKLYLYKIWKTLVILNCNINIDIQTSRFLLCNLSKLIFKLNFTLKSLKFTYLPWVCTTCFSTLLYVHYLVFVKIVKIV